MKSWRARLLALLTAVAMILALSGTAAMADVDRHDRDNGIFNNNGDDCLGVGGGSEEGCVGIFLGDNDNGDCDFNDLDLNGIDDNDFDLDGINDNCDSGNVDTFTLNEGECADFGDTVLCNVDGEIQEFNVD